jgi:hypothetical protein
MSHFPSQFNVWYLVIGMGTDSTVSVLCIHLRCISISFQGYKPDICTCQVFNFETGRSVLYIKTCGAVPTHWYGCMVIRFDLDQCDVTQTTLTVMHVFDAHITLKYDIDLLLTPWLPHIKIRTPAGRRVICLNGRCHH